MSVLTFRQSGKAVGALEAYVPLSQSLKAEGV